MNVFILLVLIAIYITTISSVNANSYIEQLTDKDFDKKIKKGRYKPWLVLFTVPKCSLCNQTLEVFSNFTQYYFNDNNGLQHLNISFGKLDCFQSSWTAMRFNILSIPQIMLLRNDTYYVLKNINITEELLEEFISNHQGKEEGVIIPPEFTYTVILSKFFDLLCNFLENTFANKGINWNRNYTIVLVLFALVLFCIFEYYFINYCCRRKKKEPHLHTH